MAARRFWTRSTGAAQRSETAPDSALSNYVTALGYPDEPEQYDKYWPADVHLVGKEIVRFHSIIWPAMLMSLDQPLPKKVLGHGWILLEGGKMSKSRGNIVDPVKLIERYGVDALKYFLLREYTFGQDGLYTNEVMLNRMNSDLANDLGNLVSRTASMIEKYNNSIVPPAGPLEGTDSELKDLALSTAAKVEEHMNRFSFSQALEEIWTLIRRTNKYIDETTPWILARNEADKPRLETVLHNLAESLRIVSVLIYPFMHTTSSKIRKQMGLWFAEPVWEDTQVFDTMDGEVVKKGDGIFPRLDIEKELEELEKLSETKEDEKEYPPIKDLIQYEDFAKLDFRVGKVVSCEKHPKADKLLVFQIKMGSETRQVISGVAECHKPEDAIGQTVIVVANLAPRMLRGMESKGMLLFADNGERFEFVTTIAPDGEIVS